MKKTVAVIFGGMGLENEISKKSAEYLINSLDKKLFTILPIFIDKRGAWRLATPELSQNDFSKMPEAYPVKLGEESGFLVLGSVIGVDVAIVALHGNYGEDGIVQGALSSAGIKYLGQSVLSCALTNDKASTKTHADKLGIPGAKWVLLTENEPERALLRVRELLSFPCFLKACSFGSSFGTYKVENENEFSKCYSEILAMGETRIIAEEYVPSDYELECAYIALDEEYYLPYGIINSGGKFYNFTEKYKNTDRNFASLGRIPSRTAETVIEYSRALKAALDIRYISRFDFFIKGEAVIFNEVNTFPGMTESSLYPKIISEHLLPFQTALSELILRVIKA